MEKAPTNLRSLAALFEIVEKLRGPNGCPWDKEQTHKSLAAFAIEEAHELAEILYSEPGPETDLKMKEELGDVLFQVVLNTTMAHERNAFSIEDVLEGICEKLIRRHPHVFSDSVANTPEEVIANWQAIKAQEKAAKGIHKDPISLNVPPLPALMRAQKIGKQTEKLKFDWHDVYGALEKVKEEINEFQEALESNQQADIEHELGDTLFSLTQLARHLKLDAEDALQKANRRFEDRFEKMVKLIRANSLNWDQMTLEEKDEFWKQAKYQQRQEASRK